MKKITNRTILKQGDKTYQPKESDGIIYWVDINDVVSKSHDISDYFTYMEESVHHMCKIVAQSQYKFKGIPVIHLDNYVENLARTYLIKDCDLNNFFDDEEIEIIKMHGVNICKRMTNQYTQKDIEKVMDSMYKAGQEDINYIQSWNESLEEINSISVIEIDEQFNIIGYE